VSAQPSDGAMIQRHTRSRRPAPDASGLVLRRSARSLLAVLLFAASAGGQTASGPAASAPAGVAPARTIGKWLVDLGRDYPLTPQAALRSADAELTLAFMQAAARIEPGLAEAYLWQHDLLWALHREDEATEALGRYVRLEPDDWSARVLWIAARTNGLQTLEERVRFWQEQLRDPNLPGEVASDLYRRMAEYHYNRGENETAARQIALALKAFPQNLAAQRLRLEMSADPRNPAARLELALNLVRLSPAQPLFAWDVARLLDEISLHREAQPWYQHAQLMFQLADPGHAAPGEFLLEMAASQIDAGMLDSAEKLVKQIIQTVGDGAVPRILLGRIARLRNKPDEAKTQFAIARSAYESAWSKVKDAPDPDLAAEIAWYYCIDDPDIERAYPLATIAMQAASPSDLARRAFGYAAAQKGVLADAQKALAPIVDADPWAACAMAIVKEKSGDANAAADLLTRVAERHSSGQLFREAAARLTALGKPIPPTPRYEDVRTVLAAFDDSLLLFPTAPKNFLDLTITPLRPASGALRPGDAIWCRFVLTNRSPFPVSLGDDLMVGPTLLVLARTIGDRERDYGALVRVPVNRRQILGAGQSMAVTQTLDVGPLRSTLIATPQAAQTIEITAIVNPVYSGEQRAWVPRPGGFTAGPVRIECQALPPDDPGPDGLQRTLAAARSGDVSAREQALTRMMMWLAEQEHLRAGRLRYPTQAVNLDGLRSGIQERFADPAWPVRARLAEALRWVTLDKEWARLASGMLSDPEWLVRMLAVRLFADHQKAAFDKVAAFYAQNDPDACVRTMAAAVRERWAPQTPPASQPTTAPSER